MDRRAPVAEDSAHPGAHTSDGCPVEVYARLPAGSEVDVIGAAIPQDVDLLELVCAVGRIPHALRDLGHRVVAVDESAAMLSRVVGVPTHCCRIEELALAQRFDAVLLTSFLVNTADHAAASAMLHVARGHLRHRGAVVVEHHTDELLDAMADHESERDGMRFVLRDVRSDPGGVRAVQEFHIDGGSWSHRFRLRRFDQAELSAAGLVRDRFLTADGSWFTAVAGIPV